MNAKVVMHRCLYLTGSCEQDPCVVPPDPIDTASAWKPEPSPVMDWRQVASNGGPPCFALTGERWYDGRLRYCGRAERWDGHGTADHAFVSLDDLLDAVCEG